MSGKKKQNKNAEPPKEVEQKEAPKKKEAAKETPKEAPKEVETKEAPKETPKKKEKEATKEQPKEAEAPKETPKKKEKEATKEQPKEAPKESAPKESKKKEKEATKEQPKEAEAPKETPKKKEKEATKEQPKEEAVKEKSTKESEDGGAKAKKEAPKEGAPKEGKAKSKKEVKIQDPESSEEGEVTPSIPAVKKEKKGKPKPESALNEDEEEEKLNVGSCRYYENKFPEVEECVVVEVKSIEQMGAYVALKEYNNIEGMILLSELSRRRIRSINKIIRVGKLEVVVVLRVDKEKGYIDLSKRRVTEEEIAKCEQRYQKAKAVNLIMRHVAAVTHQDLELVYSKIGWPLYKAHGHAFDALKLSLTNPKVLEDLQIDEPTREALLKNIQRRLTPQPVKVRADIEVTCFTEHGIDAIKDALRAGLAVDPDKIKIKLVAPPLYVVVTTSMNKDDGVQLIDKSIVAIKTELEKNKGDLHVRVPARLVHERDERELQSMMEKSAKENTEVPADEYVSESEESENDQKESEEEEEEEEEEN